jgi:hypothetical protein
MVMRVELTVLVGCIALILSDVQAGKYRTLRKKVLEGIIDAFKPKERVWTVTRWSGPL